MTKITLSSRQSEIVKINDGPLLVIAGPGSGKTRVLTERVRRLLKDVTGHFRVLALTFTTKAANEMADRLADLGEARQRATISTLHGFCHDMLADRSKPVGVVGQPQVFETFQDRKQVLLEVTSTDPELKRVLVEAGDTQGQSRRLDEWLRFIGFVKAHPVSCSMLEDPLEERLFEAYNAGLRACDAYDFDDFLLLAYQLLTDYPQIADLYRRIYGYICVDEAQDLNEAQYAVLQALCGDSFKNVMMVGDPKQSIYGLNTSSPKYMEAFIKDFHAQRIELSENYRSSQAIVKTAQALDPSYEVEGLLPIKGEVRLIASQDEKSEAAQIANQIECLLHDGHPDVEGQIIPSRCAVLAWNRYVLLAIEQELNHRSLPFYKRVSAIHENESDIVHDFQLALRVLANPKDRIHLATLAKSWRQILPDGCG